MIVCSLSFELLPPHGSGKKLLSKPRSGYCHWQMLHIPYDSVLHEHYIIHMLWLLKEAFSVVCTRTIYLPPHCDESVFNTDMWLSQKHCFNGRRCYTVPCKSHRGHTFHFYLYRVSEWNTQVHARAKVLVIHSACTHTHHAPCSCPFCTKLQQIHGLVSIAPIYFFPAHRFRTIVHVLRKI